MKLNVIIDDEAYPMTIPDDMLVEAVVVFEKMDRDMDRGWQMSRTWVDNPTPVQRCQIAADKMLTALENDNERMAVMMGAYILQRVPGVTTIDIDTSGDMTQTEIVSGAPGV